MSHYDDQMKNHSDRFRYLKKITQILLPLSLLTLCLSHSSLTPLFLQSYDYLYSNFNFNFNFRFKLFTYTTERNCIFLLCNGILVFIIQSSGLISKITSSRTQAEKRGVEKVDILDEKINLDADLVEEDLHVEKWDKRDDDDDEDDEGIDREELKRKCEDFINKVKMEIQSA